MNLSIVVLLLSGQYASPAPKPPEGAFLTMHRTSCFGRCPDYTVTIFDDRRILYSGKAFVAAKGEQTGSLSATDFEAIRGAFDAARFGSLPEKYQGWATDLPWTGICRGGPQPRCIEYEAGDSKVPQALFDLAGRIDALAKTYLWVDGPDAGPRPPDHAWHLDEGASSCEADAPPSEVQLAVGEIQGGELDRARERLAPLANDDALAAFALTCLELSAGNNRAAEGAFNAFQAKAVDWPETPVLEALVAARAAGQSWMAAASRALSSTSGSFNRRIYDLEPRSRPAGDASRLDSAQDFLVQASSFPAAARSWTALKEFARSLPARAGEWSARPIRLVGLALLVGSSDAADRQAASSLLDLLVAEDPSDLWLSILRVTSARPMTVFDEREVWALEQALAAGRIRSYAAELYPAMKAALLANAAVVKREGNASLQALAAAEHLGLQLSGSFSLIGRAGLTSREGTPETRQRLARVLDALAIQVAAQPRITDRLSARAMKRLSQRMAGLDGGAGPLTPLVKDPSFALKMKTMSLARWPIPPLTDALADGLELDEAQTLERLSSGR